MFAFYYTPLYESCLRDMAHNGRALLDLHETLMELARKPFGNDKLKSHHMKGRSGRKTFISDVGGRKGCRLIWQRFDRTIVLLLFGEHDIEDRAERLEFEYDEDQDTGGLRLTVVEHEQTPTDQVREVPTAYDDDQPGALFMGWYDRELAAYGFADHEIEVLRRLDEEQELFDLEQRMRAESFERAMNLLLYDNPTGETAAEAKTDRATAEAEVAQVTDEEEREVAEAIASPRSRESFAEAPADQLADVLSKPIEDWMVFLHPDQLKLTQRPFSGPARVRGAAGTRQDGRGPAPGQAPRPHLPRPADPVHHLRQQPPTRVRHAVPAIRGRGGRAC